MSQPLTWDDLSFDLEDGQRAEFTRMNSNTIVSKIIGTDGLGLPYCELTMDDGQVLRFTPEGLEVQDPPRLPREQTKSDAVRALAEARGVPIVEYVTPVGYTQLDVTGYLVPDGESVAGDGIEPRPRSFSDERDNFPWAASELTEALIKEWDDWAAAHPKSTRAAVDRWLQFVNDLKQKKDKDE